VNCITITADDLGLSPGVNRGIIRSHLEGPVMNASLMVHGPAVDGVDDVIRSCPHLAIGLHVDLGEWQYIEDQGWIVSYDRADTDDPDAVSRELSDQLELFERLVGRAPTHLDSHQHIHRTEPAAGLLLSIAERLGVALREVTRPYLGGFYGQDNRSRPFPEAITPEAFAAVVASCVAPVTELSCHPSLFADTGSVYDTERVIELETLTSATVGALCRELGDRLVRIDGQPKRPVT